MAIGAAIQRGNTVYVYDEKGHQISVLHAGSGSADGLQGYTGGSLSIKRGTSVYIYNEKCRQVRVLAAGKP